MAQSAKSVHEEWERAFNAGDIDGLIALYEPGAVMVESDEHGRDDE